eukprot:TRINITY_DN666_c0_g1_i4.p1 TRINITY_DN666_c0_g1~~TRINITY_DN666_c0_g1_i4.p1  ORF type:complete len:267 (-),score=94.09 TRINITY_DN666_c0_g1_i4:418-1197(-)
MNKFFGVLLFAVAVSAAPSADPEADPALLAAPGYAHLGLAAAPAVAAVHAAPAAVAAPVAVAHAAPAVAVAAPNCKVESEILVTQTCTPTAETVCSTETVETEEIEYEKVCKEVVDVLCDAPHAGYVAHAGLVKRDAEADAEADPQFYAPYAHHAAVAAAPVAVAHAAAPIAHALPVAPAVAHSAVATVKHACREVTTQHCVDNPQVKIVPVEVEHCHTVTKVACADVENPIPKTTCEAVETTHTYALPHAGYVAHHAW